MGIRTGQQRGSILGDVRHGVIDELGYWMARNPEQPFVGVVLQQRSVGHRRQSPINPFQCPKVGCDAFAARLQNSPEVLSQVRELKLAVGQQPSVRGRELVHNEPCGGVFRVVELIDPMSARERDDAVGQRQAWMVGSAGGGR